MTSPRRRSDAEIAAQALEGLSWCARCAQYKAFDLFRADPARPNGCQGYCKPCTITYQNDRKGFVRTEGSKTCAHCGVVFTRAPALAANWTWERMLYCTPHCRSTANNAKNRKRLEP